MSTDKTILRNEWRNDATLRDEFEDFESFVAFRQAEASGQVRVLRGAKRNPIRPADPSEPGFEAAIIAEWKRKPELREEFGDIASYEEYCRNEHQVRYSG